MAALSKQNYKWVIILTFIGIILVPSMVPSPTFKTIALIGLGVVCLFFELLSFRSLHSNDENFKSEYRQTLLLIILTITLLVVTFFV
jgi:heme/copper-type cytochrome/quinol oxidase subunit 4